MLLQHCRRKTDERLREYTTWKKNVLHSSGRKVQRSLIWPAFKGILYVGIKEDLRRQFIFPASPFWPHAAIRPLECLEKPAAGNAWPLGCVARHGRPEPVPLAGPAVVVDSGRISWSRTAGPSQLGSVAWRPVRREHALKILLFSNVKKSCEILKLDQMVTVFLRLVNSSE